jgi:hypothetical protein
MRNAARFGLTCMAAPLLAACFTSQTSLYTGVTPLRPFEEGAVFTNMDGSKVEHITAHEAAPGIYHFVIESSDKIRDNQIVYRFFPLPDAPVGTLVEEVKTVAPCPSAATSRDKTCPIYIYGLWRVTPKSLEITNPDCSKVKGIAKLRGLSVSGGNCSFTNRKTLERALRLVVAAHPKPDDIVNIRQ